MDKEKYISLATMDNNSDLSKSIGGNMKITDILSSASVKIEKVKSDIIKNNIVNTVNEVIEAFESTAIKQNTFEIDGIEIALNISIEGTVSIVSFGGGANMASSITVKLSKKDNK